SRVYHPDPYWTPCDYSQGPQIPEAVAISQRRLGSSSSTASGQGAVGSYEICRKLPLRLPELTLILRAMSNPLNFMDKWWAVLDSNQ
ncbi:MAG: hypothetical protein WBE89_18505, partial [Methyloceanibacter sp.]